jgi:hypothetical protein
LKRHHRNSVQYLQHDDLDETSETPVPVQPVTYSPV